MRHTEQRNPRSQGLDQRSSREIVRAIHREDVSVGAAVGRQLPAIARAAEAIAHAIGKGGRLIYVGAGTSGRLAALDAAECPPTFGVSPRQVQAVIAGGRRALTGAVEGAEDSVKDGAQDLASRHITRWDVVVGLTASGTTPYVLGALRFAQTRGAVTIGVTANRDAPIARIAQITIAPETGPEVIAGSTRMKAGTAQKMILNMLSTTAFVRLGHVYDHWMIDVALTNRKLRQRGLRILQEATGATRLHAGRALRDAGNDLRVALVMLKTGAGPGVARQRLQTAGGNVRLALSKRPAQMNGSTHRGPWVPTHRARK